MNITLSIPARILSRARSVAQRQGSSLNALVRRYLESLSGEVPREETAKEILSLMRKHGGRSGGRKIKRDEIYAGRA